MATKPKGKSLTKKITGWLHLWLGLVSGIILFFVAATGTLFVYCDEITDLVAYKNLRVEQQSKARLTPEELIAKFRQQLPDAIPFYFDTYRDPQRSFRIASEIKADKADKEGPLYYSYLDPYTGKILETNSSYNFFFTVAHLHSQILMDELGRQIVGVATFIFLSQLIGGLILWWPKKWNKNTRNTAFKIKSGTKWRRKNYDLHNVLGFYSLLPAIILAVTGLIMSYEFIGRWVHEAVGSNVHGNILANKYAPKFDAGRNAVPYNAIIKENLKNEKIKQVRLSIIENDSATTYYTTVGSYVGLRSKVDGSNFLTDKYTGKPLKIPSDIKKFDKVYNTYYDLHAGYFFGDIGKFVTFLAGLICMSLPVTGFLIWYGRKYKKKEKPVARTLKQTINT